MAISRQTPSTTQMEIDVNIYPMFSTHFKCLIDFPYCVCINFFSSIFPYFPTVNNKFLK